MKIQPGDFVRVRVNGTLRIGQVLRRYASTTLVVRWVDRENCPEIVPTDAAEIVGSDCIVEMLGTLALDGN